MVELFGVLAALAALFLLCAFFTLKCRLPSALAPLCGLACIVAVLTAAGIADVLLPAMVAVYLGCVALGVWALLPVHNKITGQKPDYKKLFTPGAVLFWGMALAFAVYFFVRQPMATGYDEMSLWATSVKLTKTDNRLYSTAVLGTPWAATQNPGLPLLSYFFEFIGHYADWKIYLAYDVLAFAVFAAVLGGITWRQWRLAVPLAAVCWCVPFFFTTYNHTIYLNVQYMTAYGDVPAGLVMGGAVAVWLMLRRDAAAPRWAVLPVLALAANIKANTFVLALVAAGLVAVDAWLFPVTLQPFKKGLGRRTGFAVLCMAAPMVIYYFWNVRYVGMLVAKNAAEGGTGETSLPLSGVVVNGIKMLAGQAVPPEYEARRAQFTTAIADMGTQYFTSAGKMSMIGNGLMVTLLILAMIILTVLFANNKTDRIRLCVVGILSLACFGGYNLMLALSYGFIFKPFQAERLEDYNRYIYSCYIGWFIIALACLSLVLQREDGALTAADTTAKAPRFSTEKRVLTGQGAVLLLAAAMLFRTNQLVLPQLSVLGFSDSEFADRNSQCTRAALVSEYLTRDDRVFFVSQGDNGLGWFSAVYDFYPVIIDYSGTADAATNTYAGGGGTFGLPGLESTLDENSADFTYYHPYTVEEFAETVQSSGCDYIYVDHIDEVFTESYAELFSDKLAAAQAGETLLYKVTDAGYTPVEMKMEVAAQ